LSLEPYSNEIADKIYLESLVKGFRYIDFSLFSPRPIKSKLCILKIRFADVIDFEGLGLS
jgi:hypothetical protein